MKTYQRPRTGLRRFHIIVATVLSVLLLTTQPVGAADSIATPDSAGHVGSHTSLVIGSNGYPVVAYSASDAVKVLSCGDPNCNSGNTIATIAVVEVVSISLVLDSSGIPVVAYGGNGGLRITRCGNEACTSGNTLINLDADSRATDISIQVNSEDKPVVSYVDSAGIPWSSPLKVLTCGDLTCSSGNTFVEPDPGGLSGGGTSLALAENDRPFVSYYEANSRGLKILRCGDAVCGAGNSLAVPDTGGTGVVGLYSSLVLDGNGYAAISYIDPTNQILKVLRCGDLTCTSGNSVTTPDLQIETNHSTSLALDSSDRPIVAYSDSSAEKLRVLRCGNPTCDSGNLITVPDTTGRVGYYPSLALDSDEYPVVSYASFTNSDLKVLHCDDPACEPPPLCDGLTPTIDMSSNGGNGTGTPGDDVILGTSGDDTIDGLGGDDTICGQAGADTIVGGDGDDTMFGDGGTDLIRGGPGVDVIEGGNGADRLLGGTGGDTIDGGGGNDFIGGFGGDDIITGGPGNETIFGGFGKDTIDGGPGADNIRGLIGDDVIHGGDGDDTIFGDRGNDELFGDEGNDIIEGGNAVDEVNGNGGDDTLSGGKRDDILNGGPGIDICIGNAHIVADIAIACETVFGVP